MISATTGQIVDGGDTGGEDVEATGANALVTMTAATGIGASGGLAADNAVETSISNFKNKDFKIFEEHFLDLFVQFT